MRPNVVWADGDAGDQRLQIRSNLGRVCEAAYVTLHKARYEYETLYAI